MLSQSAVSRYDSIGSWCRSRSRSVSLAVHNTVKYIANQKLQQVSLLQVIQNYLEILQRERYKIVKHGTNL